ncbi:hypothetical protein GJ744_003599 [Endocarpon pusillum]|uniref:Uncharacterized protein n=1 Tax=Endocarpon pusillum TaxID=364733 RepID=A0A8H7AAJ1_9EURO|nr:hypothetical protein GJ744_003599 [Endocarpon pusillum]
MEHEHDENLAQSSGSMQACVEVYLKSAAMRCTISSIRTVERMDRKSKLFSKS